MFRYAKVSLFGLVLWSAGCSQGTATLSVLLEAEDTITGGLDAGDSVENIRDGWQARYQKFIVSIGDIEIDLTGGGHAHAHAEAIYAVDLTKVPASGLPLWRFGSLQAGRWDFGYLTTSAKQAERHTSVAQADFDQMRSADATYLITGTLTKANGRSCPPAALATPGGKQQVGTAPAGQPCYANPSIGFSLLVPDETKYGPCEIDGLAGVAVTDGGSQTVTATLHGDHLFFNGFPEGSEGGVTRLAQWIADCDLNLDGTVTKEELSMIAPSHLAELDARYQLGGSPLTPLATMWDYVRAQLKTQGHMNGEGECPADGQAHMH